MSCSVSNIRALTSTIETCNLLMPTMPKLAAASLLQAVPRRRICGGERLRSGTEL